MKLTVIDFTGQERVLRKSLPKGVTLGKFLEGHHDDVKDCQINGQWRSDWKDHVINEFDDIVLMSSTKDFWSIIISLVLSLALRMIAQLFAPKPKKPSSSKSQPSVGVAGLQNTVAPGTPKFFSYGQRRIAGHIIGSFVDLEPDTKNKLPADTSLRMKYSVMYFMGVGPVKSISTIEVNGTAVTDIEGPPTTDYRLGTQDQTIFAGWDYVHQVYGDNRQMNVRSKVDKDAGTAPRSLIYTTKGAEIDQVTIFFNLPSGMWSNGGQGGQQYTITIEGKVNGTNGYTTLKTVKSLSKNTQLGLFWKVEVDLPSTNRWDLKLTVSSQKAYTKSDAPLYLFDVMETQYKTTAYPGDALLLISGVANEQISSLDSMEGSALVEGRLVGVPRMPDNSAWTDFYVPQYTRNRVWIVRDLLVNSDVGLGNRISETLWDDGAGIIAARYYEQLVKGYNDVYEQRDYCDAIINEAKAGWDWIKVLLSEGRGILIPAGGKLKYIVDKDLTPNLLYSSPGNIIEGTLQLQTGRDSPVINTLKGEFPDADQDYKVVPTTLYDLNKTDDDPVRSDQISYTSITRKSQVAREMRYQMNKAVKIKRKWQWQSPRTAMISEPYDVDKLSYNTTKGLRGYAGFISGDDATAAEITVPKEIYLQSGVTYSIHVRRQADNTNNERVITNIGGNTYSTLTLSSSLSFTPATGDIWAVGIQNSHVVPIQIEEVDFDGEKFTVIAHEWTSDVYAQDGVLPNISATTNATTTVGYPMPLLGAQVKSVVSGMTTYALIEVNPAYNNQVGTGNVTASASIFELGTTEINHNDLYNGATITIGGTGTLVDPARTFTISDYTGASRYATLQDIGLGAIAGLTGPVSYSISWGGYSAFSGFNAEWSETEGGTFTPTTPTSTTSTNFTTTTGVTYGYIRVTPTNLTGVTNSIGNWVVPFNSSLDTQEPKPPFRLELSNVNLEVSVAATLSRPYDKDIQSIEVYFLKDSITGATLTGATVNIYTFRDDSLSDATFTVTEDLSSVATYGDNIYARATMLDFFDNRSQDFITFAGVTLSATPATFTVTELDDESTLVSTTSSSLTELYSYDISGGSLGLYNYIELDSQYIITGAITPTTLRFDVSLGGTTVNSVTCTAGTTGSTIPDGSYYWIHSIIEANGSTTSQKTHFHKYGPEVDPAYDYQTIDGTLSLNTDVTQTIKVSAAVLTGGTETTIELQRVLLTKNDLV